MSLSRLFAGRRSALTQDEKRALRSVAPRTPNQLHAWLQLVMDIEVPRRAMLEGHAAPFAYLEHAYFETPPSSEAGVVQPMGARDCVVWANRGGGKTFLGAVATMLDLVFKPGIEVRVLGGSLEQAQRMQEHLRMLFERPQLHVLLDGKPTQRRLRLRNGSRCEVLAQSQTSVRGARPQKLRCDEVELFDPSVWEAAQLMPRSKQCGHVYVRAAIEAMSTMHRPHGLMAELVSDTVSAPAQHNGDADMVPRRLFRWGVIDVLAMCEPTRDCEPCGLLEECGGKAKHATGHVSVDDALTMKRRSAKAAWDAEMLCLRPSHTDAVYPEFDPAVHVAPFDPPAATVPAPVFPKWIAGMDFGFRSPTVILWACLDVDGVIRVVDEHIESLALLDDHVQALRTAPWPSPAWIGVDPAGRQRNDQTGMSPATVLRRSGLSVRDRRVPFERGIMAVRARFAPATGGPSLFVHPRCVGLIDALQRYHYPSNSESHEPVKDGADHAADALRYMIVALDHHQAARVHRYA